MYGNSMSFVNYKVEAMLLRMLVDHVSFNDLILAVHKDLQDIELVVEDCNLR